MKTETIETSRENHLSHLSSSVELLEICSRLTNADRHESASIYYRDNIIPRLRALGFTEIKKRTDFTNIQQIHKYVQEKYNQLVPKRKAEAPDFRTGEEDE